MSDERYPPDRPEEEPFSNNEEESFRDIEGEEHSPEASDWETPWTEETSEEPFEGDTEPPQFPPVDMETPTDATPPPPEGTPWDLRNKTGFFEGMIDSCRMILFHPRQFFEKLSPSGGFGSPLLFFICFSFLVTLFAFPSNFLNQIIKVKYSLTYLFPTYIETLREMHAPPETIQLLEELIQNPPNMLSLMTNELCCTGFNPVLWLISLFIIAAFYSVISLLFSGKIDYEMVFRVLVFAEVARCSLIINPIPILRELIFYTHWIVLLAIGFRYVGGFSTGKAIIMALVPVILILFLMFCCCCGSFSLGMFTSMAQVQ